MQTQALAIVTSGPLRIDARAVQAIEASREHVSQVRIANYLGRNRPEQLSHLTNGDLLRITEDSAGISRSLGIRSERGLARWAYLMMMSGGEAARTPAATDYVKRSADPDKAVKELIAETAAVFRRGVA